VNSGEDKREAKPPARLELATYALRKRSDDFATPEGSSDSVDALPSGAATGAAEPQTLPPELAKIVAAWPTLPDALRRAMLALVDASANLNE